MTYTYLVLVTLLALSLSANFGLILKYRKAAKAPAPTLEARDLLSSLMRGSAVVQIRVLDPENLMYRSPRG